MVCCEFLPAIFCAYVSVCLCGCVHMWIHVHMLVCRGTQRVSSSITFYLAFRGQGLSLKLALTDSARLAGNELCRAVCLQSTGLELKYLLRLLDFTWLLGTCLRSPEQGRESHCREDGFNCSSRDEMHKIVVKCDVSSSHTLHLKVS